MDLLKAAPPSLRPLSPIDIDGIDLRGVDVRREWHRIDLLITCSQPSFIIAIENKIDSGEHSNQLSGYKETVSQHHPDARPLFVYLTPDGSEASEDEWVSYSYGDIYRVLSRVRNTNQNAIGDDVLVFLDHYLNLIGTRLMDDPQIDELCQRIYRNHRQALQLIFDRVGGPASGVLSEVEAALRDDDRWHVFYRTATVVDFVPKTWMTWLPPLGQDSRAHPQSWFVLRIEKYPNQIDFYAEVRRMPDQTLRQAVIAMLYSQGKEFGLHRKNKAEPKGFFTRVCSRERVLTWNADEEPDGTEIRVAVRKKVDELFPKLSALPEAIQNLLSASSNASP